MIACQQSSKAILLTTHLVATLGPIMIVFELFVPNNGHNFKFAGNMQHIKYKNVVQCIRSAGVPIFKVYF